MKLLLSVITFIFSTSVCAQQSFSDTIWSLSGVGCRDSSLDPDTHESKSLGSGDVTAGIFYFLDDTNVNMDATIQGEEQTRSGRYNVRGDTINIEDEIDIYIVEDRLVIIGSRTESATQCCNVQLMEGWRDYKEEVQNWSDLYDEETHPNGTWEEIKSRNNLDENWLAEDDEEWESLVNQCYEENLFVYVLGKVN